MIHSIVGYLGPSHHFPLSSALGAHSLAIPSFLQEQRQSGVPALVPSPHVLEMEQKVDPLSSLLLTRELSGKSAPSSDWKDSLTY